MEKKQNSTSPASVKLKASDAISAIILLTEIKINKELIGKLSPDQVCKAAEDILLGLIKGVYDKLLGHKDFRNHYICHFITETDLYLLTDPEKLKKKVKEESGLILFNDGKIH
jgi:hypothetical protein